MDPEGMLSEISQTEEIQIPCDFSQVWNLKNKAHE